MAVQVFEMRSMVVPRSGDTDILDSLMSECVAIEQFCAFSHYYRVVDIHPATLEVVRNWV